MVSAQEKTASSPRRLHNGSPQVPHAAFSVKEFCTAHRISRGLFYILLKEGKGPRVMRVRGRTLVTSEAAAEWRAAMEQREAA